MSPGEADEPILGVSVRSAIYEWLVEINTAEELKAARLTPRTSALLSGPPGCGKTTLAHHLAARLGIPMVNVGSEMLYEAFLGASERNAAALFNALATSEDRCVVFLDEIDAIGGKRQEDSGGGAQNGRNSMLTVLLRKIETFNGILIAATNRPESLDPALWRRFGMQISVDLPDDDARFAILKRYGMPYSFDEDLLSELSDLTEGAAPSLLRQLMESVKRQLVVGPRIRRETRSAAEAFALAISQNEPHPDYDKPVLWRNPQLVENLSQDQWPPKMETRA
ncbi:ATP-binding protein [Stappia sp. F7233]|uniref:ATP-binding protein n=1 Tax=Stappia albiluteola TaxID=2758565 RepID=A0A839AL07_9HYPH|nr:ATP-binding protein [Stappia albiluteola]MBA5779552.1 ATP-binding protein [Stappia albiluteola]